MGFKKESVKMPSRTAIETLDRGTEIALEYYWKILVQESIIFSLSAEMTGLTYDEETGEN